MELFHAHRQWSSRPEDERFTSLADLYDATKSYADTAGEKTVAYDDLHVEAQDGEVALVGKGGVPATLTHWSFGQLAARVGAPAAYLRDLPADLAVENLNHGLTAHKSGETAQLLFHENGSLLLRAITSQQYSRIWNWEVVERLRDLESRGWTPATPDIRVIDNRLPLYASDHDMFAFLMHPDRTINEGGLNPSGLKRGLIASNSEVGAGALKLLRFFYREMCGNHIIWGAENVVELSARHVGDVRGKFNEWSVVIQKYLDGSASADEAAIQHAMTTRIAGTKDDLLDTLFGKRALGMSRKALEASYAAINEAEDGDPLTAWGMAQGITRHSQTLPYADARTALDTAAGRLLSMF